MKRCKHGMIETHCSECSPNKVVILEEYTTRFKTKDDELVRWKRTRRRTVYDN